MLTRWMPGDWPVTQGYGCTAYLEEGPNPNHPECPAFHDGIDLGANCGTPVYCPVPATCVQVGVYGGGPFALILDVGGWWVWLLHLEASYVAVGQSVPAGALVGHVGTLGFSTGCHLHFEVTPAGGQYRDSVDPGGWLTGSGPLPAGVASRPSSWPLPWWSMSREGKAGLIRLAYWFLGRQPHQLPDGTWEHYRWADTLNDDLSNLDSVLAAFTDAALTETATFPLQPEQAHAQVSIDQVRQAMLAALGGKTA